MTPAPTHLARLYGLLALLACAASVQALALPRWPWATPLQGGVIETALRSYGFKAIPLEPQAPRRTYQIATSPMLRYALETDQELRLVNISVRERLKFDMANISGDQPEIRLEAATVSQQPPFDALGRIDGRITRQTCLVPGMEGPRAFAVRQDQLWAAVDTLASENTRQSLLRVIGLGSRRSYRCVLITLLGSEGGNPSEASWHRLLGALRPALEAGALPSSAGSTNRQDGVERISLSGFPTPGMPSGAL